MMDVEALGNEAPCCWICLSSEETSSSGDLQHLCKCPASRVAHRRCLAKWQLISAGKSEEHSCRFCEAVYPSWKESLTPANLKPAIPVVSVHYNGVCYRLRVKPGPDGFDSFQRQLQRITGLSVLDCMQITFQCRSPDTAQELNFKGITAFDAAIHCASISAAERMATVKEHQLSSNTTEALPPCPVPVPTSRTLNETRSRSMDHSISLVRSIPAEDYRRSVDVAVPTLVPPRVIEHVIRLSDQPGGDAVQNQRNSSGGPKLGRIREFFRTLW